ncbi:hypothetical protein F5Y00DRAFT_258817 [Daldinia vernicosa]|uniref:uncharacterized protein n=1 Tax=Daldinia vernicosa TaxID=114800 RepID=UPI00200759F7|nr:uncharacterized protein F5Y00DRAFT_258817 [Daldinia vernicosa]KAI0852410.1 hypothetical protein F5Y00DRAFT_258817 [Daldinia vernicosa]
MNRVQQAKNKGARARLSRQRANPPAARAVPATPATPAASTSTTYNEAPGNEAPSDEASSSHLISTNNNNSPIPNYVPFNTPDSVANENVPEQAVPTPEPSNHDPIYQDFVNQGSSPGQYIPIPNQVPNQGGPLPPGYVSSQVSNAYFHNQIFEDFAYDPSEYSPHTIRLDLEDIPQFINDIILEGVVPLYLLALAPDQVPDFQLFPDGNDPADENSYSEGLFEEEAVSEENEDVAQEQEEEEEQGGDQEFDLSYYFGEHGPNDEVEVEHADHPSDDRSDNQAQGAGHDSGKDSNEEASDSEEEDNSGKGCDQDKYKDQGGDDPEDPDQGGSNQGSNKEGSGHQSSDCKGSDPKGSDHKDSDHQASGNQSRGKKSLQL